MSDAIVIGSGPNGLVAANLLADRGWQVVVYEEQPEPGGSVRSAEATLPGFHHDLFSAFYPLGVASPVLRALELERWGVRWRRSPAAVAHPLPDGSCAVLSTDLDETAASLDAYADGDGEAWRRLYALWQRAGEPLVEALMTPFPPVRSAARLATALRSDLVRFLRLGIIPVRQLAQEHFRGAGGPNLLAGNALHADLTPDSAASGMFGWLLCALGQQHGYPVPEGGAGRLTDALVARLQARGGAVVCGRRAAAIVVRGGRAIGVRFADGEVETASRAVIAATGAPQLYEQLLADEPAAERSRRALTAFRYDSGTIKVDWALSAPIPWTAPDARRAGTVHVADGIDALSHASAELSAGRVPERPFLVMGQYSMVDPTRAPAGCEVAWGYTHVPQHLRGAAESAPWDATRTARIVDRMEDEVERLAPGFRDAIRARNVLDPISFERSNRNLVGGALNGGTAQLHQQLVLRPIPGLGRAETPIAGLYLGSASAHPGGGVHGAPGSNAARAALAHDRLRRLSRQRLPLAARGARPGP